MNSDIFSIIVFNWTQFSPRLEENNTLPQNASEASYILKYSEQAYKNIAKEAQKAREEKEAIITELKRQLLELNTSAESSLKDLNVVRELKKKLQDRTYEQNLMKADHRWLHATTTADFEAILNRNEQLYPDIP